ncbi:MAG: hypothetical protein JWQ71_3998 [Pedosphaera sp.]|nr:hypothetical protein [Pedosphaera sp.]
MKPDDFEKQLQQQSMRSLPVEWRAEILQAAQIASGSRLSALVSRPKSWVYQLFWPCPQAWAGLAAVWLAILGINFASGSKTVEAATVAKSSLPASPETIVAFMITKEQKRELARLIEPFESQPAEPPKPTLPQPRSERPLTVVIV